MGQVAQPDPRRWRALAVLALVQFMLVLDNTVVNVALPSVQRSLGLDATGLAWTINAYVLTFGGLLLLGGRIADRFGRRRTYLIGIAVFAVASGTSGAAQTGAMLIVSRFGQGLGAALVAPAALSLVTLLFTDPKERARAFSIWGGLAALGGTAGVVLSGALADLASWRWIFFINLPVAALCLAVLPRLVSESRAPAARRTDILGSLLVTIGLVALVYALLQAGSAHGKWIGTLASAGVSLVALVGFVIVETRSSDPLVPLAFLRNRTRGTAYVAGLAVMAAFFATFFSLTLYMQDILRLSPLQAGLAYVPYGAALGLGAAASGAIIRRRGPRVVLPAGMAMAAVGLVALGQLPVHSSYAAQILPWLIVLGVGNGLAIPALTVSGLSDVPPAAAGLAAGLQNTVLQIGGAVGLAALVSIGSAYGHALQDSGVSASVAAAAGFDRSFQVGALLLLVSVIVVLVGRRHRSSTTGAVTPVSAQEEI